MFLRYLIIFLAFIGRRWLLDAQRLTYDNNTPSRLASRLRQSVNRADTQNYNLPYTGGSDTVFVAGDRSPRGIEPKSQDLRTVRRWMVESRDRSWGEDDDTVFFYDFEVHDRFNRMAHYQCLCFSQHILCTCDMPEHQSVFVQKFNMEAARLTIRTTLFPSPGVVNGMRMLGYTFNGSFPSVHSTRERNELKSKSFFKQKEIVKSCPYSQGVCEFLEDYDLLVSSSKNKSD